MPLPDRYRSDVAYASKAQVALLSFAPGICAIRKVSSLEANQCFNKRCLRGGVLV